jgi:hypothetical protein
MEGCEGRDVGRQASGLKRGERKRPATSKIASKGTAKSRRWSRESVNAPRKGARLKSSSVKKERAVVAEAGKLRRESAQSARTTAKEASASTAAGRASASTSA